MFSSSKQLVIASHFLLSWREARISNKLKFVLSLLSSLIVLFGSRTSRRAIAIRSHCHSLTQFFTTPEGKCIVVYCRVDSATTPPPSSSRQLVRSFFVIRKAPGRNLSGSEPSSVDRRASSGNPTSSQFGNSPPSQTHNSWSVINQKRQSAR